MCTADSAGCNHRVLVIVNSQCKTSVFWDTSVSAAKPAYATSFNC